MRKSAVTAIVLFVFIVAAAAPRSVWAQQATPPQHQPQSQSPPKLIAYRGVEMGVDVTAGRQGEAAFYLGASSTRGSLAVRFSQMDVGDSVPCSVGVMYEHAFTANRTRITPVAGASLSRVFSCADDSDGVRPSTTVKSVGTFSGGVRIPMFAGHHVVGSLKVLAFSQRQFATSAASDATSKGITVGFVIGRR